MKRLLIISLAMTLVAASIIATATKARARNNTWPCEVILCAVNPSGPLQLKQCLPPFKDMFLYFLVPFRSFPACQGSSADVDIDRGLFSGRVRRMDFTIPTSNGQIVRTRINFDDEFMTRVGVTGNENVFVPEFEGGPTIPTDFDPDSPFFDFQEFFDTSDIP